MSGIKKWLLGNEQKAGRNGAIWNMIASILYSFQSALLLLVITRRTGLVDGGIFTIAYTVTQMMTTIGSYGMREFQVSDVKEEYKFSTYFSSRIVTVIGMIIICMGYAILQGYNPEKLCLVAILCIYRVIEDIDDVFHGEMQKSLRFDVSAKIMTIRILFATMCFIVTYLIFGSLLVSCMSLTIGCAIVSLCLNSAAIPYFENIKIELNKNKLIKLLIVCFPLCISGFIYNYLVNAPKYAIDRLLTDELQTIFNILFMPIFAINMFSMFIFKPMIADMGIVWNSKDKKKYVHMVVKQSIVIIGITLVLMLAGYVAGPEVLGAVYGVELFQYRGFFVLLILFGGFAAFVSFYVVVLTIMRKQNFIVIGYLLGTIVEILFVDRIVGSLKLLGAGIMYGVGIATVLVILVLVFVLSLIVDKRTNLVEGNT